MQESEQFQLLALRLKSCVVQVHFPLDLLQGLAVLEAVGAEVRRVAQSLQLYPEAGVLPAQVAKGRDSGVGAEPAAASSFRLVNRRQQSVPFAEHPRHRLRVAVLLE